MAKTLFIIMPVAFVALLWLAAAVDIRNRRIPNIICFVGLAAWPIFFLVDPAKANLGHSLAVPSVIFVASFALWCLKVLGGGDVKLIAVTSLWSGPDASLLFLVTMAMAGGVLALLTLKFQDWEPLLADPQGSFMQRGLHHAINPLISEEPHGRLMLPYGIAIAIGGTISVLSRISFSNLEIF